MQFIKKFQNEQYCTFASVVSEPAQSLLMDIWNEELQSIEYIMTVMNYSLQVIYDHKLDCWLSDVGKLEALFEFDYEATGAFLIRMLKDSPLRKYAFIHRSSTKHSNGQSLGPIVRLFVEAGIEVKVCASSVIAMEWLLMPNVMHTSRPVLVA
jgi:hypothetical protein